MKKIYNRLISLISSVLFFCLFGFDSQAQDSDRIDIKYQGHIYVAANVDGKEGDLLLDSGADFLYLDSTYYAKNQWNFSHVMKATLPGAGVKPKEIDYILDTAALNIGFDQFSAFGIPVLDLRSIVGDGADGILGFGFFRDRIIQINYQNQFIKIHGDVKSLNIEEYIKIPVEIEDRRIYLEAEIEIHSDLKVKGRYLLDLGTSRSVILTSVAAKHFSLSEKILNKVKYNAIHAGVGGQSSGYDFHANFLTVGSCRFHDLTLDYALDTAGALASSKYLGLMGNEVFERFDLLIDYANSFIYLKPEINIEDKFYGSNTGFSIADKSRSEGVWVVTKMYENAQAEHAGLRMGDQITHVDGKAVASISYQERMKIYQREGSILLNVERSGREFEIEIPLMQVVEEL